MQSPSPSVPFTEFVLKALEHPPYMFVSKLAACCSMLFLTRSDPNLLRSLCHKWAVRFAMDRAKLIFIIHRRSQASRGQSHFGQHASPNGVDNATQEWGITLCNPDDAIAHFLRILNSLVATYFSWNWHRAGDIIQLNREHEMYVRLNILPICMATSAEDGLDDEEHLPWLLTPQAYAQCGGQMLMVDNAPSLVKDHYQWDCQVDHQGHVATTTAQEPPVSSTRSNRRPGAWNRTEKPMASALSCSTHGQQATVAIFSPNSMSQSMSVDSGLTFLSVSNYREVLRSNKNGLVIIFHAQFSAKSNDALEVFQQIDQRRLLDPMPIIALVHSVAEPELTTVYNVSWFPTIIYVPPDAKPCDPVLTPPPPEKPIHSEMTMLPRSAVRTSTKGNFVGGTVTPSVVNGVVSQVPNTPTASSIRQQQPTTTISVEPANDRDTRATRATANSSSITPHRGRGATETSMSTLEIPSVGFGRGGPSPTEVLYGFNVSAEGPCNSSSPLAGGGPLHAISSSDSVCVSDHDGLAISTVSDHHVYPINGVTTIPALVEWLATKGLSSPRVRKTKDTSTRFGAMRAEEKFRQFRELHSAVVMLRRLQGLGDASMAPDVNRRTADAPLFIFLGGGMAAGKSTAAMALAHSSWWRKHKDHSVLVNADEFKVAHPHFQSDQQQDTHTRSTRAAESLLVQAINQGRSIVFDGTMMWAPFVLQVIDMIRHAHLKLYKQGPGYKKNENVENYFTVSETRPTPLPKPYIIRFLGITVEPEIAIPRGFLRKFSTGRGVPIKTQLLSFKLFAENFPVYAELVDEATLYNNNVFVNLAKGELPPVLAHRDASEVDELHVLDNDAYQLFMKQRTLNVDADNILELYPAINE